MDNESNEIYAAFGLDAPADEATADTSASAETADDPGTGPEDSKPANTSAEENAEPSAESAPESEEAEPTAESDNEPAPEAEPEEKPDTSAEDANYAASFMGRKNPFTGEPIFTKADFEKYKADLKADEERRSREEADAELEKLGITTEQLEGLLQKTKFGKEIQAALDYTRKQAADTHRKAIDDLIAKDIAEINQYDPTVKDVESLRKTARGKEIEKRVASGRFTWAEAWKLENFDAMRTAKNDAAKQAAINAASAKDHLQSTAQRGSGELDVPPDVYAQYEAVGFKDKDEIRKSYASYLKDIKKG